MEITFLLSFIAVMLTLLNTIIIVGKSHFDKKITGINDITILISIIIAIIWFIYGCYAKQTVFCIGYLFIIILLLYLLFLFYCN